MASGIVEVNDVGEVGVDVDGTFFPKGLKLLNDDIEATPEVFWLLITSFAEIDVCNVLVDGSLNILFSFEDSPTTLKDKVCVLAGGGSADDNAS